MKRILAVALAVLCLPFITVRGAAQAPNDISPLLTPIIQKHEVPGMAAAVIRRGDIVAIGVAGVRTRGKADKIAVTDCFHLGSDTKAMTAFLCGILVDEGKLKWTQTLGTTFSDLKKSMYPQYQAVTLEQLLNQRGGAPGAIEKDSRISASCGWTTKQRHPGGTEHHPLAVTHAWEVGCRWPSVSSLSVSFCMWESWWRA